MRVYNVLTDFPQLKIALTHGAWTMFPTLVGMLPAFENLFIGLNCYLLMLGWRDYIDAANYLCQDQMMFGTCYPVCSAKFVVDFYKKAGFREKVQHKIYYQNAECF